MPSRIGCRRRNQNRVRFQRLGVSHDSIGAAPFGRSRVLRGGGVSLFLRVGSQLAYAVTPVETVRCTAKPKRNTSVYRTARDFIALTDGELPALAGRAKYYRALAAVLLARLELVQSAEAREELKVLAEAYERLALQVEKGDTPTPEEADRR